MEPNLSTPPELQGILEELEAREPIFHRPEFGTSRAHFEQLTEVDFWEIGASGRCYSRAFVLDELERRFSKPDEEAFEAKGFHCRSLGEDVYLLTYTLIQDQIRVTRRTTIWRKTAAGWKIAFHQGTVVQDG